MEEVWSSEAGRVMRAPRYGIDEAEQMHPWLELVPRLPLEHCGELGQLLGQPGLDLLGGAEEDPKHLDATGRGGQVGSTDAHPAQCRAVGRRQLRGAPRL